MADGVLADTARGSVTYREVDAKSLIRLSGVVDSWFLARYGMNLYRGCEHGCAYCDGRAERYYVSGDFERDIVVKRNAPALFRSEIARAKEPGFVALGGGVCDAYQPAEVHYKLARQVLEVVASHRFPVHVLTKSALVERDFDLLERINQASRTILSFSVQTVDDQVRDRFEPRAAPIEQRLRLMKLAKSRGFTVGAMAMPVLPGVSDQADQVDALVGALAEAGADFICFSGLTLRPGVQKRTYLRVIADHYAQHLDGYERAYSENRSSGSAGGNYYNRVRERFRIALGKRRVPSRAPRATFTGLVPLYTEVAVLLEHREHELQMLGKRAHGLAASGHAIQGWARAEIARRGRRRGFSYQELEREFVQRLRDGSLAELPRVTWRAVAEARELIDGAK